MAHLARALVGDPMNVGGYEDSNLQKASGGLFILKKVVHRDSPLLVPWF